MNRRNLLWALVSAVAVTPVFAGTGAVVVIPPREAGDASALMRASNADGPQRTIAAAPLVGTPDKRVVVIPGAQRSVPGAVVVPAGGLEKPNPSAISTGRATQVVDVGTRADAVVSSDKAEFMPIATMNDNGSVTPIVDATDANARAITQLRAENAAKESASDKQDGKAETVAHRTSVSVGIGINTYSAPRFYQPIGYAAPVYVAPAPVYVAPTYCPPAYYPVTYVSPCYSTYYYSSCYPTYSYCPPVYCRPAPCYSSGLSLSFSWGSGRGYGGGHYSGGGHYGGGGHGGRH